MVQQKMITRPPINIAMRAYTSCSMVVTLPAFLQGGNIFSTVLVSWKNDFLLFLLTFVT